MDTADAVDHRSMQAILAPTLSVFALILCTPAMIWHLSNRNVCLCFLIAIVMYDNVINFFNPLIWPTNDVNSWWDGYVYCDIQVKLSIGTQVAMPGALLCIFRSLAMALDVNNAPLVPTRAQRLRNKAFDVLFCIGLPLLAMIGHFVIQGARYFIFAVGGCNLSYDESWPTIALYLAWPPVICIAATCYCVLIIIRIIKYTSEFSAILGASRSKLTTQRFIKLFGLSSVTIAILLPLQAYSLYYNLNLMLPLHPYSWEGTHGASLERIIKVKTDGSLRFDHWIPVALSVLVFVFSGLGHEATDMYRSFFNAIGLKHLSSSFATYLSSGGKSSSYEAKPNSWYNSVQSRSAGWTLGMRQKNKGPNIISTASSLTDTTMSGGLDGHRHASAAGLRNTSTMIDSNLDFITVNGVHPKNDSNV